MKLIYRTLIPIIVFLFINSASYAQLKAGIKGGANLSSFNTEGFSLREFTTGYHAGIFARVRLGSFFAIQPELLYNTKGRGGDFMSYQLDYIDIPVLAVINFTKAFNIHFGPYGSFLTDGRVISGANGTHTILPNYNRTSFEEMDYGLTGGAAVESRRFMLGLRYNYGLQNIIRDPGLQNRLGETAFNSVWQLYLGIFII